MKLANGNEVIAELIVLGAACPVAIVGHLAVAKSQKAVIERRVIVTRRMEMPTTTKHSTHGLVLTGISLLLAVPACDFGEPGFATQGADPETGGSAETGSGDEADPLQACLDLPEAQAIDWQRGVAVEPNATSTEARRQAMGDASWALALDLLGVVPPASQASVAASPASMMLSLGMTYGRFEDGLCGTEIETRMHFPEVGEAVHQTLGSTIGALEGLALEAVEGGPPVVLNLRQSIWSLTGEAPELSEVASYYGAQTHSVDRTAPNALSAIRTVMNCVIETQSDGLLPELLPPSLPQPDTTSFDVNVAVLQAPWATSMQEASLPFTRDGDDVVELEAIRGPAVPASIFESDDLLALELPLRGDDIRVQVIVPKAVHPDLESLTASLDLELLTTVREQMISTHLDVTLPKVTIPSTTIDYYAPLGFECPEFTLRSVPHGAAVVLDENGISAAAGTAAEVWEESGEPTADQTVVIDRPFLFFVYDVNSRFVLYSGRFAG